MGTLTLVSNAGTPVVSEIAIEGLSDIAADWKRYPPRFAAETFAHPPTGAGDVLIDPEQARILQAVADYDRVAVRTGRGVGKTAAAALIVHWWLTTRYPALVVTSAGTWNHLEDKLWPEILQWGRQWIFREAYEYQTMGIYQRENPEGHRAEATSSDQPVNVEGFHSPHLLILIDEAKGMPDEIYDALVASLTGNEEHGLEQKMVALSTPPLTKVGWFARVSSGTEWKVVHVSGLDSPRVSRKYIAEIEKDYGVDSPQYQAYVLGDTPESTSETVIPLKWFESCQQLDPLPAKRCKRRPILTCDVAREGEDLSTFGVFDRMAFNLCRFKDGNRGWTAKKSLMEVVARCVQMARLHPTAYSIVIDDTGLGGGVTDRLRELQMERDEEGIPKFPPTISIIGCKFGSKPWHPNRFFQKKDQLWWASRLAIQDQAIALPTDDQIRDWQTPRGSDFKTQMTGALYEYMSQDQINVLDRREKTKEKTNSLPTKSPDLAHAFILGLRYYMKQNASAEEPEEPPRDQGEALHRVVQRAAKHALHPPPADPYRRRR